MAGKSPVAGIKASKRAPDRIVNAAPLAHGAFDKDERRAARSQRVR
jgi:hypothetical protein